MSDRPVIHNARTVDVDGCARCEGEGHPGLVFEPLTRPAVIGLWKLTHWAPCPKNGEPILLADVERIVCERAAPS